MGGGGLLAAPKCTNTNSKTIFPGKRISVKSPGLEFHEEERLMPTPTHVVPPPQQQSKWLCLVFISGKLLQSGNAFRCNCNT